MKRACLGKRCSVRANSAACRLRSCPTLMRGTISQSSGSAASIAEREYAMPPHSSTTSCAGSRPWITSHTREPRTPILGNEPLTLLVEERLGGAEHPRRPRQGPGDDAAGGDRRLEGAPRHLALHRPEEPLTGRGHSAADDDHLGIEDVEEVRDSGTQVGRGVAHHFEGELIPFARRVIHRLRRDLGELAGGGRALQDPAASYTVCA